MRIPAANGAVHRPAVRIFVRNRYLFSSDAFVHHAVMFYAHSGNDDSKADWQLLRAHLFATADLASRLAAPLGLSAAAYAAGLFHDLGKYTPEFQKRLTGAETHVDHATAGARAMLEHLAAGPEDKLMAELIAYAIAGHHAGLPDRKNDTAACLDLRVKQSLPALDPAWKAEIGESVSGLAPPFLRTLRKEDFQFSLSVMGRMLFSCLVDADFKDTEAFYAAIEGRSPDRNWPTLAALLPGFRSAFEAHMHDMAPAQTPLNRLRSDILAHVRGKAAEAPGLFTLTVPTGGGKTLASLGFALDHAQTHGHRRIIYAIPFTSIIDQVVDVFRSVLGPDYVLAHHSSLDEDTFDPKVRRESRDKLKLAMEDWAAPVVVTTNVQFFESLFAARPSRARKLHNIAGSVIILDEAQTLPRPLLLPCIRVLDELTRHYGCTIVLCTATQPALDQRNLPEGLPLEGRELAPDPRGLAQKLRRARIVQVGPMANAALVEALGAAPQALVIVNSRSHALDLFREAQGRGLEGLLHLTTRQCATHRRSILAEMRKRLEGNQPCRVIATSLIEAGVDVDFPRVWRAEAGLDQIVQAAGRCNRNGHRPLNESLVTVFSAPDYPPPQEIAQLVGDMARMSGTHEDLMSLEAITAYFREVYWRLGQQRLDVKKILHRFSYTRSGTNFAYRTVAEDFRMIESGLAPVIIPYDAAARKAVDELGIPEITSGSLARRLQPYVVQVPPKARNLLIRNGHVAFDHAALRSDQFAVLKNESLYGRDIGLLWENADYLSIESALI